MAASANGYFAAQDCAWRYMHMLADVAIVVDMGASVDYGVNAEAATWLDYGPGHYLNAFAEIGVTSYDG